MPASAQPRPTDMAVDASDDPASKASESQDAAAEASRSPLAAAEIQAMAIRNTVDIDAVLAQRYRLQCDDLLDGPRLAVIVNVSVEGVERLRPVLHFGDGVKPLTLTPQHADDLAYVTGSAVLAEWIGQRVQLAAVDTSSGVEIAILPVAAPAPMRSQATTRTQEQRRGRTRFLMVALVLLLIVSAVYLMENATSDLWDLASWLPGLSGN